MGILISVRIPAELLDKGVILISFAFFIVGVLIVYASSSYLFSYLRPRLNVVNIRYIVAFYVFAVLVLYVHAMPCLGKVAFISYIINKFVNALTAWMKEYGSIDAIYLQDSVPYVLAFFILISFGTVFLGIRNGLKK